MTRKFVIATLLAGTAFTVSAPAYAAQEPPAAQAEPEVTEPDASDTAADATIQGTTQVDDLQSKIELLQAQVEALQEALEGVKKEQVKAVPAWKGAPEFADKDAGFTFKPRGRIQYDAGYVWNPDDDPNGGLVTRNLGFNSRVRRIRLGAEGTIPGGFGYKFEMDYANGSVGFGDAIITYAPSGKPYSLAIGNQESLNGLEQITSSRFTSFMERAAFDDAFINTRRIGLNAGYVNSAGDLRLNAGLFAGHSIDGGFDNEGWIAATRAVYSPLLGGNQFHFGLNFQYRKFQDNNNQTASNSTGAPSTNQIARYRARPFTQTTDVRFVDTGNFAAKGDSIFGVEFGGIFKSLHVAAEGQYLKSRVGYDDGDSFAAGDLDQFVFNQTTGCQVGATSCPVYVVPGGNPSFWGGYVEAGYFLTGETRGYKNGLWDRTKVLKPFSKGGWGAVQINGRVDYLDLQSDDLFDARSNNFATGTNTLSNVLSRSQRGGEQLGLLASVVWIPEDWMRFYFQYSHSFIKGGPFADEVEGITSGTTDVSDVDYGVDFIGTRAQIDF